MSSAPAAVTAAAAPRGRCDSVLAPLGNSPPVWRAHSRRDWCPARTWAARDNGISYGSLCVPPCFTYHLCGQMLEQFGGKGCILTFLIVLNNLLEHMMHACIFNAHHSWQFYFGCLLFRLLCGHSSISVGFGFCIGFLIAADSWWRRCRCCLLLLLFSHLCGFGYDGLSIVWLLLFLQLLVSIYGQIGDTPIYASNNRSQCRDSFAVVLPGNWNECKSGLESVIIGEGEGRGLLTVIEYVGRDQTDVTVR